MVKVVKDKGYVKVSQKRLVPTENGMVLCDFLTAHFADVLAYDYTARLEDQLDRVAAGLTDHIWDVGEILRRPLIPEAA